MSGERAEMGLGACLKNRMKRASAILSLTMMATKAHGQGLLGFRTVDPISDVDIVSTGSRRFATRRFAA